MRKVLIVDDHNMVCEGLSRVLAEIKGLEIVASVSSGEEALEFVRKNPPDIMLIDVHMPGMGGLGATMEVSRRCPSVKIIAMSGFDDSPYPTKMLSAGASGYIDKSASPDELVEAIHTVMNGEQYLSKNIAQKIALQSMAKNGSAMPFDQLAPKELQIAQMIVDGVRNKDIADRLNISDKTVSTHRSRIFSKLSVNSDVELARLAMRYNVLGVTSERGSYLVS